MEIDGAFTDGAASWHGDAGLAPAGEQGAENTDAGAHCSDDVVSGVLGGFINRAERDGLSGAAVDQIIIIVGLGEIDLAAEFLEDFPHGTDIREAWGSGYDHRLVGEQGGGHLREGGVFGSVDTERTGQRR